MVIEIKGDVMSKKKVLFIGNSHTYFNDMPYYMQYISLNCNLPGVEVKCTMLADGGRSLEWHSTQKDVRYNIIYGGYDFIVLQNNAHPFDGYEVLKAGTKQILDFVAEAVKKPVVTMYMTWSKKGNPEDFAEMRDAYNKVAEDFGLKVAPVGERFFAINGNFDTELYANDGAHPSKFGSFVAALTILESLFDVKITDFPRTIETENRVLYSINDIEAECIRAIGFAD